MSKRNKDNNIGGQDNGRSGSHNTPEIPVIGNAPNRSGIQSDRNNDWQNFSVSGTNRMNRRGGRPPILPDLYGGAGFARIQDYASDTQEGFAQNRVRDNNTIRGRDRYGSKQAAVITDEYNVNAGFRDDGRSDASARLRQKPELSNANSFINIVAKKLNINSYTAPAFFVRLMLAITLSFSVVYAVVKTSRLGASPSAVFIVCAAMLIFFSIFFHNAYVANGAILASIAGLGIYIYHLYKVGRFEDYRIIASYHFRRFTYWAASFFYTGQPNNERYEFVLFIIICSIICLFVYFITIKKYIYAAMFTVGFATFCVQWCYGFYAGRLALLAFIGVAILGYIWHIYTKNKIQQDGISSIFTPAKFLRSIAPLFFCMLLMIAVTPVPNKPIQWQFLYDIYNKMTDRFNDRFYYYRVDNFALNTTGFSNGESFLSGPVRLNNTQVLTIVTEDPALYLKGNGKEVYTGISWKNNPRPFYQYPPDAAADDMVNTTATGNNALIYDDDGGTIYPAPPDNQDSIFTYFDINRPQAPWGINQSAIRGVDTSHILDTDSLPEKFTDREAALAAADELSKTVESDILLGLAQPHSSANLNLKGVQNQNSVANTGQNVETTVQADESQETQETQAEQAEQAAQVAQATQADESQATQAVQTTLADESQVPQVAQTTQAAQAAQTTLAAQGGETANNSRDGSTQLRAHHVTDLESPDLVDVREMEEALALLASGAPTRDPGPLYYSGDTEVQKDVDEFAQNHVLYLYRLVIGANQMDRWRGYTIENLNRSSRWMMNRNLSRATVRFDRMKTFSLFTPAKMVEINNINMDVGNIYEENGALLIENIMTEGFSYDLGYYSEDQQAVSAQILLQNSYPGLYRDMLDDYDVLYVFSNTGDRINIQAGDRRVGGGGSDNGDESEGENAGEGSREGSREGDRSTNPTVNGMARSSLDGLQSDDYFLTIGDYITRERLTEMANRADDIRYRYTELPETLPERVWILAEQLTEGADSDYEKALRLEYFLYTNYEYSLNVGYLPKGEDFVDNFLFKLSEGYCTHFASALAVMARCIGIPSRYVEGYTMPEELSEDGVYKVTNAEAHAWVEIYFEGYGWRKFEPTATYQDRFKPLNIYDDSLQYGGGEGYGGDYYDYMEEMMRDYNNYGYTDAFDLEAYNSGLRRSAIVKTIIRAGLIIIAIFIPIVIIAVGRRRANKRFSAFSAAPGQAVRNMYRHYIKILHKLRYDIKQGETLSQFAERVDGSLKIGHSGLASALEVFEKLLYSEHKITETDKQIARAVYPQLLTAYSLRKTKLQFFLMKDVIAVI